jgi:hypothetical protein
VLATIADHDKPAALDAARATLADPTDRPGVPLNAGMWITSAVGS